jgi:hypothetical protein
LEPQQLTYPEMSIETRITNGADQRLPLKEWRMDTVSRISIPPSNAEVDNVNTSFPDFRPQNDISRFYIIVDKVVGVYIPNSRNLRRNARSEKRNRIREDTSRVARTKLVLMPSQIAERIP